MKVLDVRPSSADDHGSEVPRKEDFQLRAAWTVRSTVQSCLAEQVFHCCLKLASCLPTDDEQPVPFNELVQLAHSFHQVHGRLRFAGDVFQDPVLMKVFCNLVRQKHLHLSTCCRPLVAPETSASITGRRGGVGGGSVACAWRPAPCFLMKLSFGRGRPPRWPVHGPASMSA